jgi:hypothetical protein
MKDIRTALKDGDPIAREGGASSFASARMRANIASGVHRPRPFGRQVFPTVTVVTMCATATVVWMVGRSLHQKPTPPPVPDSTVVSEPRQVQFVTPGGTRVLWTLHPKLEAR